MRYFTVFLLLAISFNVKGQRGEWKLSQASKQFYVFKSLKSGNTDTVYFDNLVVYPSLVKEAYLWDNTNPVINQLIFGGAVRLADFKAGSAEQKTTQDEAQLLRYGIWGEKGIHVSDSIIPPRLYAGSQLHAGQHSKPQLIERTREDTNTLGNPNAVMANDSAFVEEHEPTWLSNRVADVKAFWHALTFRDFLTLGISAMFLMWFIPNRLQRKNA